MTTMYAPMSSFDFVDGPQDDRLTAAAASIATHAVNDPSVGVFVVVVRPTARDHSVLAGGDNGVLRAAVSVAAASGHQRLWDDTPDGDTLERPVQALPEVVRAAAEAAGVITTHTGTVRRGDALECVAIWFETEHGVADAEARQTSLSLLTGASEREAERRAGLEAAAAEAERIAAEAAVEAGESDVATGELAGVIDSDRFDEAMDELEADEAALVLIEIDDFDQIVDAYGTEIADQVLTVVAGRMAGIYEGDVVARLDGNRFAALVADRNRSLVMQAAKQLVGAIAEPLGLAAGPDAVTATVGLAHQIGLVDAEELLELAEDALESGRRAGTGRLVLAA